MFRCSSHSPAVRAAERLMAGNNRPYGASEGVIEPSSLLFRDMEALLAGLKRISPENGHFVTFR